MITKLPSFKAKNQNEKEISSKDLIGSPLVLFFYPKDFTPGCTKEVCQFRDDYSFFQDNGIQLLGISADSPKQHLSFISRYKLPFDLLSDSNNAIRKLFKIKPKMMGLIPARVTFIFDEQGQLIHFFDQLGNATDHVEEAKRAFAKK